MEFAVHYSAAAANLVDAGEIQLDRFKCPAWPDLLHIVQEQFATYVHFPLRVGLGIQDALDAETNQPADWRKVETLLHQTNTPFVNLHLSPSTNDYPDLPVDTTDPSHIELLTERLIQDALAVVRRFGPEQVIVENDHDNGGRHLRPAYLAEVIHTVVKETGCGFLFDLSHARLAAHALGVDVQDYIDALPTKWTRELHVTGLQSMDECWVVRLQQAGIPEATIQQFAGRLLDHTPMTDTDWAFLDWALAKIEAGSWGRPWVTAFEYGGVGPLWEAVTDAAILAEQVPRLYALVNGGLS